LKREYRSKLLRSVHPGGSILSLDFAALEARVLLYEAGGRCEETDLYGMIVRDVFHGEASRNAVKGAVISELYGSSREALGRALSIQGKELETFVSKIKRLFKTGALLKRVKAEFVKNGWITNRYGRRVKVDEPLNHIFVNYYAQSTGADVALLGFSEILSRLKLLEGIRPIFLLHDALIIDCPKEHVDAVKAQTSVKVAGYVQKFYVKVETVSCTSA
jgi:DNA polymerase I-like protein with 3'-5' exonuclease and polymerase domains